MTDLMMQWWLPVAAAPFVGSFLALVAVRLPAGEGIVAGRSHCPACRRTLAPRDLVPLLSWLANAGRCRFCASPISMLYPCVELLALLVAAWAAALVSGWLLWATCVLGWTLLVLAVIDVRTLLLPDPLTLPLIPAGLGVAALLGTETLIDHALGAAAGFVTCYVLIALYRRLRGREGLGLGDAKLLAAAGAWVSWSGLPSVILVAAGSALIVTLARLAAGTKSVATEQIAFGPYLCAALWLIWLYGPITFALS